jgi:glycosyltransferase involved in cell wall biosynthesis
MRLTICQGAFYPVPPVLGGAIEKVWFGLGQEFAGRGHEVVHFSRCYPGFPSTEKIGGVMHQRVSGFESPRSLLKLKLLDLIYSRRLLRELPPADLLVTNTFWLPILLRNNRFGKIYVHVGRFPKGQLRYYVKASRLQTVSSSVLQAMQEQAPQLSPRMKVVPYPLPGDFAQQSPKEWARREKQVAYVGRLHREKGVDLLIEAFASLPQELRNSWRLLVVGSADAAAGGSGEQYRARLQSLARKVGNSVQFTGLINDSTRLQAILQESSLFVYPSLAEKGESFGLAPLEAMACGCPALVSQLSCFLDFITDGHSGFVFDHRHQAIMQLKNKLQLLLCSPERLAEASRAAYDVSRRFLLPRVAEEYLKDFEQVVGSHD